jgi:hypothetical protein
MWRSFIMSNCYPCAFRVSVKIVHNVKLLLCLWTQWKIIGNLPLLSTMRMSFTFCEFCSPWIRRMVHFSFDLNHLTEFRVGCQQGSASMESNTQFSELRVWMKQRRSLKKLSIPKGILQWKNLLRQRDKEMWLLCETSDKIFNDNLINLWNTLHTLHHEPISIAWSPNMLPTGECPKWDRKRLRSTIGSSPQEVIAWLHLG